MRHIDLFSGIGGFAYAAEKVWKEEYENVCFCDIEPFCQAVIRKHWPNSRIYGDIRELIEATELSDSSSDPEAEGCVGDGEMEQRCESLPEGWREDKKGYTIGEGRDGGLGFHGELIADTDCDGFDGEQAEVGTEHIEGTHGTPSRKDAMVDDSGCGGTATEKRIFGEIDLLTGGFPCQPFSHAGKRRGKNDNRYLWPEMFEVIQLTKPRWVVAENVHGILSIEGGLVFEQVCLDLEKTGYEVWSFIIPACAKDAPHRRDRIWIVGHRIEDSHSGRRSGEARIGKGNLRRIESEEQNDNAFEANKGCRNGDAPDATGIGNEGLHKNWNARTGDGQPSNIWNEDWLEVATRLCRVDDGLPTRMDGLELSKSKHRIERLKALGNAIVPQVAIEIMKAIKEIECNINGRTIVKEQIRYEM